MLISRASRERQEQPIRVYILRSSLTLPLSLLLRFLFDNEEEDLEMEKIRSDCNVFEDHDQW